MPRRSIGLRGHARFPRWNRWTFRRSVPKKNYRIKYIRSRRRYAYPSASFRKAVRRSVNYIPRGLISKQNTFKRMFKFVHKMQDNQNYIFQYGKGFHDDKADYFKVWAMWGGRSDYIKSICKNYYKFCVSKVKIYFKNFKLSEYAVKFEEEKSPPAKGKEKANLVHYLNLKGTNELIDINNEFDSTRTILYFKDTSGLAENLVSLNINNAERSRLIPLRRNLKIKDTIYCKPKKYMKVSDWDKAPVTFTKLLEGTNCPDQVINARHYFGPALLESLPVADEKVNYIVRYLNFDAVAYITFTFAGINSEIHA